MRRRQGRIKRYRFLEMGDRGSRFIGGSKQEPEPVLGCGRDWSCLSSLRKCFEPPGAVTSPQKIFGACLPICGSIRLYYCALHDCQQQGASDTDMNSFQAIVLYGAHHVVRTRDLGHSR